MNASDAQLIQRYTRMRCRPLAEEAIERAQAELGECAEVLAARARLEREFDNWPRARALFEQALGAAGAAEAHRAARLDLVEALMVLGGVDAAAAELGRVEPQQDARAGWLRAALAAERGDTAAECAALERAIAALPKDSAHHDIRIDLAVAAGLDGQYGAARSALEDLLARNPEDPASEFARTRLDRLSSALPADAPGRKYAARLTVQPGKQPGRTDFGPPILELCARYMGLELRPGEVAAPQVRPEATLYDLAEFMHARGFVVRRIAATPQAVFNAIDLGVPLIVQEVSVATPPAQLIVGYDKRLSVFIFRDPTTPRPAFHGFERVAVEQDLYGNGALIILGRAGAPETRDLEARADKLGLVNAEYLEHLDAADRLWRSAQDGPPLDEDAAIEAVSRAGHVLRFQPVNRSAWLSHIWAQLMWFRGEPRDDLRTGITRDLFRLHWRFPNEAWVHRAHGYFLRHDGRLDEAWVSLTDAQEIGDHSALLLRDFALIRLAEGNLDGARKYLHEALEVEPSYIAGWELLAHVDRRLLLALDAVAVNEARETRDDAAARLALARVVDPDRDVDESDRSQASILEELQLALRVLAQHQPLAAGETS